MAPLKILFTVTMDKQCPLYKVGELFTLSDQSFLAPGGKAACLILVRQMTELLLRLRNEPHLLEQNKEVFSCSGCSGLIKFSLTNTDKTATCSNGLLSTDEEQILSRVQPFPLFQAIKGENLNVLAGGIELNRVQQGEILIKKGMAIGHLYMVVSGELAVYDGSVYIAPLGQGEIFGEMSYFSNDTTSATVKAVNDGECLAIDGLAFSKLLDQIPALQGFMAQLLASRLLMANSARAVDFETCIRGRIQDMPPVELLQIFHLNQKTGILSLDLPNGAARISFREGAIVNAGYLAVSGKEAIAAILRENEGAYRFTLGLSPEEMKRAEIGNFMALIINGVRLADEALDNPNV